MKKTILIAFATVLCAGGAMAQDSKAKRIPEPVEHKKSDKQEAKNPGAAKEKGAVNNDNAQSQKGDLPTNGGKTVHPHDPLPPKGGNKGKDIHGDEKDSKGTTKANAKHAGNSGNANQNNATDGKHHHTIAPNTTQGNNPRSERPVSPK